MKVEGGGVDSSYAARDEATHAWHRLSQAEQHVLRCFLAGRLPAGQVDAELARARSETSPRRNHGELLAHGPDGQIRERDTHGHDPRNNPRLTFGGARG